MTANHEGTGHLTSGGSRIEFIGGPFDGHAESFPFPPEQLPRDLMWFVCANVFHILDGKSERSKTPITSIAVYERRRRLGVWCYRFVGAISPQELNEQLAHGDFCFESSSSIPSNRAKP